MKKLIIAFYGLLITAPLCNGMQIDGLKVDVSGCVVTTLCEGDTIAVTLSHVDDSFSGSITCANEQFKYFFLTIPQKAKEIVSKKLKLVGKEPSIIENIDPYPNASVRVQIINVGNSDKSELAEEDVDELKTQNTQVNVEPISDSDCGCDFTELFARLDLEDRERDGIILPGFYFKVCGASQVTLRDKKASLVVPLCSHPNQILSGTINAEAVSIKTEEDMVQKVLDSLIISTNYLEINGKAYPPLSGFKAD